jgi:hypothetical protein
LIFTEDEIKAGKPRYLALQLPAPYGEALGKALRRHVMYRTQSATQLWEDLNPFVGPAPQLPEQLELNPPPSSNERT